VKRIALALLLLMLAGCDNPCRQFERGDMVKIKLNGERGQIVSVWGMDCTYYVRLESLEGVRMKPFELEAAE